MSKKEKLLEKALSKPASLKFDELCALAEAYGFVFSRSRGSHRMYKSPAGYPRIMNFQQRPDGGAKPYQVRELLDALREMELIDEKP